MAEALADGQEVALASSQFQELSVTAAALDEAAERERRQTVEQVVWFQFLNPDESAMPVSWGELKVIDACAALPPAARYAWRVLNLAGCARTHFCVQASSMDADEVQRLVYKPDAGLDGWTPIEEVGRTPRALVETAAPCTRPPLPTATH